MANNKAFKVKNGLELEAYSKAISDTAVDVFVYDTRKDSDGGSWRKRTQHTSWYNEALNTSTRGSRKEFPAVAVIVCRTNTLTIYDGDDPDLPMWMVFNTSSSAPADYAVVRSGGVGADISSASALNGIIALPVSYNGLFYQNFVTDDCYRVNTSATIQGGNIAARNGGMSFSNTVGSSGIVHATVNDVAMTVLPNAPIDAATGLPVPTIAVATNGGVSVIKDDGTVVSDNNIDGITPYVGSVAFWNNETLAVQYGYASTDDFTRIRTFSYPAMTEQYQYRASQDYSGFMGAATNWTESLTNKAAIGSEYGLIALHRADDPSEVTAANQMVAQVASSYNTGWMNGDIKLATLSDTDDTDVTGAELVTNGTFDTDTSNWTAGDGATVTHQSGRMRVDGNVGTANQAITTVVGKSYTVSADLFLGTSASCAIYVSTTTSSAQSFASFSSPANSVTFTATSTTTYIIARVNAASNTYIEVDNVSVRLAEEDRSVNGNGLQVFGTVTKDPVATGADLVAYSGFSTSNYLMQPYNSDLDFGTGDFSIISWIKSSAYTDTYSTVIDKAQYGTNTGRIEFLFNGSLLRISVGTTYVTTSSNVGIANKWQCVAAVRRNGTIYLYADGELVGTGSASGNVSNTSSNVYVGVNYANGNGGQTKELALLRISATAPSPEQIKKIYEDEKVLFQENAQATLYGSSDAVTALAYDDSTNMLHVGTSAGRSVFQGLRRVDNTTTAVGAAISASNGLVADE
jgi:hypothetical protein